MPNADPNSTTIFSAQITPGFFWGVAAFAAVVIAAGVWLARSTDFLPRLSRHLCRWAPLYLILGPPALTYIIACGFCSVTYLELVDNPSRVIALTREQMLGSEFFRGLYAVEWVCSVLGALAFASLVYCLRLPAFWYGVIAASMSLTAVYRTAACRVGENGEFGSGPDFLSTPVLTDAIPVLIGMCIFFGLRLCCMGAGRTKRCSGLAIKSGGVDNPLAASR